MQGIGEFLESRGRYIAFTDDDTRPEPRWVEEVWRAFETQNCDAVAGRVSWIGLGRDRVGL